MTTEHAPERDRLLEEVLTTVQKSLLRSMLQRVPTVALPRSGLGYVTLPATIGQVLEIMESLSTTVTEQIRRTEIAEANLTGLTLDLKAAGRLLAIMTDQDDEAGTTEIVTHTEAGELEKFHGWSTDWQERRWTISTLRPGYRDSCVRIELTRMVGEDLQVYELEVTKDAPIDIYPPLKGE
jgi:hypothetical protein